MYLSHAHWFGIFALVGFCVLLVIIVPEARTNQKAVRDPAWWFWVTILAGLLVGIMPYLLVFFPWRA